MTEYQIGLTLAVAVFGTVLTRAISFILFPDPQKIPSFIKYLGKVLPFAVMGLLVVYSYKDVLFCGRSLVILKLVAGAVVVGLHIYKRNMLLSIAGGTIFYIVMLHWFL